ncbi:LysR family transcriptional regulator [Clostridium thailandense]|uniref:LysR family transcriptional regulator n=1 Tax=Clostridium thailandense TaxID=2794346 RepID=UPI00398A506B
MNINQFECFVSLAQYLNFTKASRVMHITQPAFSRYISNLEDELGIVLFHRNKRSVVLTEAGKVFLEDVKRMLRHLNNGIINAKQVQNRKSQILKIGFIGPFASYFLPKLLDNIRNTHPNIGFIGFKSCNSIGCSSMVFGRRKRICYWSWNDWS